MTEPAAKPCGARRSPVPHRWITVAYLLPALCTAPLVELGLRTMTLPRLARLLGIGLETSARAPQTAGSWRRMGTRDRAKYRAARHVLRLWPRRGRESCLRLALVAGFLLRRRQPSLRVGAIRANGRTVAHAWLVIDGRSLDPRAVHYQPLTTPAGRS